MKVSVRRSSAVLDTQKDRKASILHNKCLVLIVTVSNISRHSAQD